MSYLTLVTGSPQKLEPTTCIFVSNAPVSSVSFQTTQTTCTAPSNGKLSIKRTKPELTTGELLRCKRRISFTQLGYTLPSPQPATVARRNERERNRVRMVNMGFATLRQHVPNGTKNKKMSKVETLRSAVEYIKCLQQLLSNQEDHMSSEGSQSTILGSLGENQYLKAVKDRCPAVSPQSLSPTCSTTNSPSPSTGSEFSPNHQGLESPSTCLSPEEEELLAFASWFS
ncbi:achaete-scute homolog 1a-like [Limulus polyphemus]|uniref:Achaete-scute homolog 1a-like n=1 Tax=Limulus polyphemus TaxID=6850 RepID=A0ABM1BSU0_LIMPO|nr:achaete-scute homolog 1a-like [Limulus polyphemus]